MNWPLRFETGSRGTLNRHFRSFLRRLRSGLRPPQSPLSEPPKFVWGQGYVCPPPCVRPWVSTSWKRCTIPELEYFLRDQSNAFFHRYTRFATQFRGCSSIFSTRIKSSGLATSTLVGSWLPGKRRGDKPICRCGSFIFFLNRCPSMAGICLIQIT